MALVMVGTKIDEEQKKALVEQTKAKGYATLSEFIRSLIRDWQDKQEKAA